MEEAGLSAAQRQKFSDPKWGAERLAAISIFKSFSADELASLYRKGELRVLPAGAHAVVEGDTSRGVYLIFSGSLAVLKTNPSTGSLFRIAQLEEGQHFGEMSLFDTAPRSATVAADIPSCLYHLQGVDFDAYLQQGGDGIRARFFKACAEDLAGRFRVLNADYIQAQQLLWQYALRRADPRSEAG